MSVVRIRKYIYIFSLVIIIPGLVSLFYQGLNLGIDFKGGSLLQLKFSEPVQVSDLRASLDKFGLGKDAQIQTSGTNEFIVRTLDMSQKTNTQVLQELNDKFGKTEIQRNEKVGPIMGQELTRKALTAVAIACVLMLIYITIRFEFKFGVAAILALIHDVLVVVGLFSIFRWEVDSAFVAAILTILGYSIMDTIVLFDRVREHTRNRKKESYESIVDVSVMQTMNRSINTVLTVIFCLVALLAFGGPTIKPFITALLIGVITGCYSSIFVASPLWYDLKIRENN